MKHWFRLNALAFGHTLAAMVRHPVNHGLNLLVIAIAAAFPFGFYLLLTSVADVAAHMPVEPQLSIFLKPAASAGEVGAVKELLARDGRVANARFVGKDEALKGLQARVGSDDLLAGLAENPLPDAFLVTTRSDASAAALDALKAEIAKLPGIDEVQLDSAWAQRLERLIRVGEGLLQVIIVLLAVALALITGNAIRMQILTRRDEIEVAKLIGATDAFIRRPFLYAAAMQGLIGGLLACGIVGAALHWLNPTVAELASAYGQRFALHLPGPLEIGAVCLTTVLLSLVGAWLAVWRHLRRFF
ncbi:permease-like cell division protein FtsX [Chitinolyticbacter meiyuanensis]|uniref:permease-like cell division protein FtsX n=1 Tax=Chitinolyticbacter meiyuanensis TaxID=682798 RepID=UPI0011E5E4AA|nr:permease-like cell division protein FtsX [Chitinolyticbacter meiyuanensis]